MNAVLSSGSDVRIVAVAKKVAAEDERNRARVVGSVDSEKAPPLNRAKDEEIHRVVRRREKKDADTMVDCRLILDDADEEQSKSIMAHFTSIVIRSRSSRSSRVSVMFGVSVRDVVISYYYPPRFRVAGAYIFHMLEFPWGLRSNRRVGVKFAYFQIKPLA
jgi:hypothetical protein